MSKNVETQLNELACEYEEVIDLLIQRLAAAQPRTVVIQKPSRKEEVLGLLIGGKHLRIADIAKLLGVSDRNVSSLLSYLRADGYRIATDSRGYKFIEQD